METASLCRTSAGSAKAQHTLAGCTSALGPVGCSAVLSSGSGAPTSSSSASAEPARSATDAALLLPPWLKKAAMRCCPGSSLCCRKLDMRRPCAPRTAEAKIWCAPAPAPHFISFSQGVVVCVCFEAAQQGRPAGSTCKLSRNTPSGVSRWAALAAAGHVLLSVACPGRWCACSASLPWCAPAQARPAMSAWPLFS